jgi:hypothetical protein
MTLIMQTEKMSEIVPLHLHGKCNAFKIYHDDFEFATITLTKLLGSYLCTKQLIQKESAGRFP